MHARFFLEMRALEYAPRPFSRVDLLESHAAQDARGLTGEVGQDDVSASAPQAHERLHHHLLLVDHAQRPAGFDHRVLAGDLHEQEEEDGRISTTRVGRVKHFGQRNLI